MFRPRITRCHGGQRRVVGNWLFYHKRSNNHAVKGESLFSKMLCSLLFKETPEVDPVLKVKYAMRLQDSENREWDSIYRELEND